VTYKILAAADKTPFPFAKNAAGGYPNVALPNGVLSFDQATQAYYIAVLAAAQKIDAGATISDDIGMVAVTMPDGKNLMLSGGLLNEYNLKLATVEAQLARAGIDPPAVVVPVKHDPDPAENLKPFQENGRWVRYTLFGMKVACAAPASTEESTQTPAVDFKTPIFNFIQSELLADQSPNPPLTDQTINALGKVYAFVKAMAG
jgi:hypothetical protein